MRATEARSCSGSNCGGVVVEYERPRGGVGLAIADPEGVAREQLPAVAIEYAEVMQGVPGCMQKFEGARAEREP